MMGGVLSYSHAEANSGKFNEHKNVASGRWVRRGRDVLEAPKQNVAPDPRKKKKKKLIMYVSSQLCGQ